MAIPPQIELANLGMADSIILMVLALVVFGPRRLPQIGRQIGKLMYEFRKASNDFKFQMEEELRVAEEADRRKKEEEEQKRVAALAASAQASVSAPPEQVSPAQTIEAQADIGAVESPAASSEAPQLPDPGSSATEAAAAIPEPPVSIPRIQPPQTGEPVSAARPHSVPAEDAPRADEAAHSAAANGATPYSGSTLAAGPAAEADPAAQPDLDPAPSKEPVTQNG